MGSCPGADIGLYCPDTNIDPSLEQYQYLGNTDIGPNPLLNVFAFLFLGLGLPEMLISLRIKLFLSSKAWFHRSRRRHTIAMGEEILSKTPNFIEQRWVTKREPFICLFSWVILSSTKTIHSGNIYCELSEIWRTIACHNGAGCSIRSGHLFCERRMVGESLNKRPLTKFCRGQCRPQS